MLFCQVNYSSTILHSITVGRSVHCYENNFRLLPSLPQNPHDPKYLSNPPHLVLVLVAAASPSTLTVRPASRVQQLQAERGEVGEDAQQVDDVHAALDEPEETEIKLRGCLTPNFSVLT